MTHGGDGFESQIDPSNPDIVYAQSQYGFLVRYDRRSGEEVGIKPQPGAGEDQYRWNWDAPLHISAHSPTRIYFSANKVFRSDDRGDSWTAISDDLSQQINRNELPVMGRVWGIDAVMKNQSTSPYGTIVAFHESPANEDLLVVGSDDGLIHVTTDGGSNWRKAANAPGAPNRSYVNAVLASQHDEQVIYAAFNHHKYGDFKPYVFKSSNQGQTWTKISANLPERGSVYTIAEDHKDPNLIFVGTEFGVFFSPNAGGEWKQLKGGLPTIAVRDIAIHPREDDLILGTFGRGFYVMDDYSSLRGMDGTLEGQGQLMAVRDPWLYIEKYPLGLPGKAFQGDDYYMGDNLGPVAMFTYFLKEAPKTIKDARRETEKDSKEDGKNSAYPSYDDLKRERMEEDPYLLFTVKDDNGQIVRKLTSKPSKGVNRIHWDMRYASDDAVSLSKPSFYNPFAGGRQGTLVAPGDFTAELALYDKGTFTALGDPVPFTVKALNNTVLPAQNREAKLAFQRDVSELNRQLEAVRNKMGEVNNQIRHIEQAILETEAEHEGLFKSLLSIKEELASIRTELYGDPIASTLDIDTAPSVSGRVGLLNYEQLNTTSAPTKTHQMVYEIAMKELTPLRERLLKVVDQDLAKLESQLEQSGAPYTPYRLGRD